MKQWGFRHAFTGLIYEPADEGLVKVTDPKTGQVGIFDIEANPVSGSVRYADYHMCRTVARLTAPVPTVADTAVEGS